MADEYSLYDAKANLSRIVKQVRETGHPVVVTVHGEPAVEIRPYKSLPINVDARLAEMRARGETISAKGSFRNYVWKPKGRARPGGLQRFLDERAEE